MKKITLRQFAEYCKNANLFGTHFEMENGFYCQSTTPPNEALKANFTDCYPIEAGLLYGYRLSKKDINNDLITKNFFNGTGNV